MMKKKIYLFFFLLCVLSTTYATASAEEQYLVQAGDTLWKISQTTGLSLEVLKQTNGLIEDQVFAGQTLRLPKSSQKTVPQSTSKVFASIYRVQAGDSLFSIAKQADLTLEELKSANQLTSDQIQAGQILMLPHTNQTSSRKEPIIPAQNRPYSFLPTKNITYLTEQYLGIPYISGGTDPTIGFDCSGFTQYVYAQLNQYLPRTSSEQYLVGQEVNREDLLNGDLVFFDTYGGVSHVGIYLRDNQFISATTSRGIAIDSLDSSYWGSRYLGAKRIM